MKRNAGWMLLAALCVLLSAGSQDETASSNSPARGSSLNPSRLFFSMDQTIPAFLKCLWNIPFAIHAPTNAVITGATIITTSIPCEESARSVET